ncbi:MAG TPA: iron ABC transporter permease [Microbacteriaceae bacterium]|nr:iron ABC transporter permease [Microbacteriaceae bacterium]
MQHALRAHPVVTIVSMAVGLFSLLPFLYLFIAGFSVRRVHALFAFPATLAELTRTVGLTAAISVCTVLLGVGAALLVVRSDLPFRRVLTVLFALPLAVPGFVSAYAVYSAGLLVAPRSDLLTSFGGATIVISLTLYPYVFLACVVGARTIDPAQEEVARSLGARPAAVLWRIVLPRLRPAIAGGVLIVALHVLSEYGAMVQLKQRTLTTEIMSQMLDYGDYETARSLSMLLALLALVALVAGRGVSGRASEASIGAQATRPPGTVRLRGARLPVAAVALAVPVAAVGPTVFMTVHGLTTPHRATALGWQQVAVAGANTIGYAVAAGLLASLVGFPVSWWISRRPSTAATMTERSVWLAHAIPAAILALALVFLATRLAPGLYKTPAVLIAGYVILFLPLAVANQRVGLESAFVRYDEAAAALGSPAWRRLGRVSLPLALPGVATGALLVGLDASKELTTTLMLLPFNTQTLATGLWGTTNGQSLDFTAAAPYALVLIALGSIPVYLITRRTLRYLPATSVRPRQPAKSTAAAG